MRSLRKVPPGRADFFPRNKAVFGIIVLIFLPALGFAQTLAAASGGTDREEKFMVAVFPLAGQEVEMNRRFYQGTLDAVVALEKYHPQIIEAERVYQEDEKIPTDIPPRQSISGDARYALTGGLYPGRETGEFYLQLWLWDMRDSTMIYTDDLIFEDINEALESVPGLVEWLFSHIHEELIEAPETEKIDDPLLMIGLRVGFSPRWYTNSGEQSAGAWALRLEGGISGAFRLSSWSALELGVLFTGDTQVHRGSNEYDEFDIVKFSSVSLMIPLVFKLKFQAGPVRISPLTGIYGILPLGKARYETNRGNQKQEAAYSISLPLGLTGGIQAAVKAGPGRIFADLRYAGDFGEVTIDMDDQGKNYNNYYRYMVSISLGYEFGFFDTNR
jgi:hypothetical protein